MIILFLNFLVEMIFRAAGYYARGVIN